MSLLTRSTALGGVLAVVVIAGQAWAGGAGQEDLDRATKLKLSVKNLEDLGEVIRLAKSALEKGLDDGNADFARKLLAAALIKRGTHFAGMALLARPGSADRRKTALADLEKAAQLSPKQPQVLYLIARLHLLPGGDVKRAGEALGQAIDLSTDQAPLRAKALVLRATIEKDPKRKMADLDEAVRIAPSDATTWRARGLLLADTGKPEAALADLDKAIELAPEHVRTYEVKAIVLARQKKYDEALVSLDKAQELQPGSILPLLQKAQILGQQANLEGALHELTRAHSIAPENPEVLVLRAEVYRGKDEPENALADADAALKLQPKHAVAMRLRAELLAEAGRPDEAIAQLEQLRQAHPRDVLGLLQLGLLCTAQQRYERAVEAYSAVLVLRPDERHALRARGDALLNLGRHQQAIADYEALMKLEPKDPGTLNNLAWVLATSPEAKLRDGKRAVELATQACQLTDYKAGHILSTLAAAYAETGDFEAALKWIQKGLDIAKDDEKEPLGKELQSYRAGKPFRELLSPEKPQDPQQEGPADPHEQKPEQGE